MFHSRSIRSAVVALLLAVSTSSVSSATKESLRPAVGKPLQEAQKDIQAKKFKEALVAVDTAEKVGGLTPYESFVVNQMRGAASAGAGDAVGAAAAFEKVLAAKRLPPDEQLRITEAVAGTYLRAKNYPKAIEWVQAYREGGGNKPETLALLPQAYYLSGDFKRCAQESAAQISAVEKAGRTPGEDQIKMLASSLAKLNDMAAYTSALEKMVKYYPTPAYWADVIQRTSRKPGFNRELELDMYRLLRATGNLNDAKIVMDAAQVAEIVPLHGESKAIVEEAYAKKIFGVGDKNEIDRQARLKAQIESKYAADLKSIASSEQEIANAPGGDPLVKLGLAYVTYGQPAKGIPMIEQGLRKPTKNSDQAKLQLGYAQFYAGDKAKAISAFKQVGGTDGAGDFARLWIILASRT